MSQAVLLYAPTSRTDQPADKQRLDQFYTKASVAKECHDFLNSVTQHFLDWENLFWVEPSAGEGTFYSLLPKTRRIGVDIDPRRDDIICHDFLNWDYSSIITRSDRVVVIGNPPFGHRAKLAIQFFNRAAEFADTIAMIVPVQFRKYSVHKHLHHELQWVATRALPKTAFYTVDNPNYRLNAEFQVWTKIQNFSLMDNRIYRSPPIRHPDFEMWQYNNTPQALHVFSNDFDFAVPRQGYKDYNRKETDPERCEKTTQWILFKAHDPVALSRLMKMDFVKLSENNTITPGFGKACVVKEYERLLNEQTI